MPAKNITLNVDGTNTNFIFDTTDGEPANIKYSMVSVISYYTGPSFRGYDQQVEILVPLGKEAPEISHNLHHTQIAIGTPGCWEFFKEDNAIAPLQYNTD